MHASVARRPPQTARPETALKYLRNAGVREFFYHHMPLLTLFGNLRRPDVVRHNTTAMEVAAAEARTNVAKCVVASTHDRVGTQDLLTYVPTM
jgi:hypothetical protein